MGGSGGTRDELWAPPAIVRSLRRFPAQLARAWVLAWHAARLPLLGVCGLQAAGGAAAAVQVLAARRVLEVVLAHTDRAGVVAALGPLAVLAGATVASRVAAVVASELGRLLGGQVELHAMCLVADAAAGVPLVEHDRPAFHDRLQRAQLAAMSRPVQMINSLSGWLGAATTVVAVVAVVVAIAPVLALVLVLGAVPLWWASRATSRALYAFSLEQTEADRRRQYWFLVLSHRTYAAELRAHGLAREIRGRLESVSRQRLGALRRLVERRILVTAGASVLGAAALFGALVLVVASVDSGHLSLSAAGAVAAAAVVLGERLHGLGSGTASLHEHAWYMQDLSAFVDRCARAGAPDEPEEPAVAGCGVDLGAPVGGPATTSAVGAIHGAETPNRLRAIHLDHVSFQYPSGRDAALDDVSLTIAAGTVVALVGENGSGKTTLAKLVAGLYDPTAGSIRFETAAGNTTAASVRRRNSAFVPQDFGRFWATAGDNIAFGDVDRLGDPTTVELAARHVGAHETIAGLPLGYATMLGTEFHGGTDLSQGQWQRLALARAAFRDRQVLVLDEPTAALDPAAEAALFTSIRRLFADRTVLLVSHRFGSCRTADQIFVVHRGRIVEHGTHDELVDAAGRYARLFELQAAWYQSSA